MITSSNEGYPTEHGRYVLNPPLLGLKLMTAPLVLVKPQSFLIGVVHIIPMHRHEGGGTDTGYYGMSTSLGTVRMQIHCLGRGYESDKPCTSNVLACQKLTLQTAPPVPLNNVSLFIKTNPKQGIYKNLFFCHELVCNFS